MSYRVVKAMVIGKDQGGHNRNYYYGAVIPWLSEAQAKHLLSHGLVEKIHDAPAPVKVPAAVIAGALASGEIKPAKVASKEAWVDYGVAAKGQDRGELEALTKAELVDLLG
jgi:hypothetical protein